MPNRTLVISLFSYDSTSPDWKLSARLQLSKRRSLQRRRSGNARMTRTSVCPLRTLRSLMQTILSDTRCGRLTGLLVERLQLTAWASHLAQGWSLDNTAPTPMPIFPLVTRPTYPLPPQPEKVVTAWTRDPSKKAKAKAKARDASGSSANGFVPENTLVRARRIRIDPRKWGRQKTVFDDASGGTLDGMRAAGTWECVDLDDESAVGEPKAVWVFKARDGTVRRRDVISLGQKHVPHTDRFTALLEGLNRPITAPLAVLAPTEADPILVDDISLAAESPRAAKRVKSLSPPPYVPTASRSLLYNEEDTFALMQATQAADELEAARKKERESQLALLGGLLADATPANETRHEIVKPRARVEGFADDSDDEDFLRSLARPKAAMNGGTLNLRGGAASESDEDDSGSDDSSDSDRDEDVVMTTAEDAVSSKVKISLAKGSLKDMFKPQEKQAEGEISIATSPLLGLKSVLISAALVQVLSHFSAGLISSSNHSSAHPLRHRHPRPSALSLQPPVRASCRRQLMAAVKVRRVDRQGPSRRSSPSPRACTKIVTAKSITNWRKQLGWTRRGLRC